MARNGCGVFETGQVMAMCAMSSSDRKSLWRVRELSNQVFGCYVNGNGVGRCMFGSRLGPIIGHGSVGA